MQPALHLVLLIGLVWPWHTVTAQDVPLVACPRYFQYLNYGNQYVGKITLPNLPMGSTRLEVQFSQQVPVQSNYYGQLSLYQDQQTTVKNLENGIPVMYRVDFPTPNVLPKLVRITVNNRDICTSDPYPAPSTNLNLKHTLESQSSVVNRQQQGNGNIGGFANLNPAATPQAQPQPQQNRQQTLAPQLPSAATPTLSQQPANQPSLSSVCGLEGSTVTPFVHGGTVVSRGQLPWLTAIYHKQPDGTKFLCGGSLISSRTVITAAHCFKLTSLTANRIVAYLGRYNLESYSEEGVQTRDVQSLLLHPEYNMATFPDADLAMLQLQSPVSFTSYIRPICLWSGPTDISLIAGQTGYVAGWGADERGREVSPLPKMVNSDIVSEAECVRSVQGVTQLASPRTLCAGNRDGTGPCMGDSGGGLMISHNGRWALRGVVSAGRTLQQQCNLLEYVIYCDLAKHLTWVQSNALP